MTAKGNRDILHLFDRPAEPICIAKSDSQISFSFPASYLPEEYQPVAESIMNRNTDSTKPPIKVKPISIPNLGPALELARGDLFSIFLPKHQKCAGHLIKIFLNMRTYEDFLSLAVYARDRVNTQLFIYALSVAILHRADTKHLQIPHLAEILPGKFMDCSVFYNAREEANLVPAGSRRPIEIPINFTASDHDPEHRVAYWREDIGVNLHHAHWHLVYPFQGPDEVVRKDRRGELFYFMHQQMIARYNIERMCNALPRVLRMNELREPIPEAYFPKLDSLVASRVWPGRPAGAVLRDVNRKADGLKVDIADLERWRDRIYEAIHSLSVKSASGTIQPLTEAEGIDILGNILEASNASVNPTYYGDLHNQGHNVIGYCHDPDHRYLEPMAVMGDSTTAVRDPVFYRWHAFMNEIFLVYKNTLPPYTNKQLGYPGITVTDVKVNTANSKTNQLQTHWSKSALNLSGGLDFAPRGSIFATITHLDHTQFSYTIQVTNSNASTKMGTVRIFVAPTVDESNRPINFAEQKNLMIQLDKFTVNLKPGQNVIQRNSVESTLTIPYESTFRSLDDKRPAESDVEAIKDFSFCRCGWPQHLLLPKGTDNGYEMELFVMISNYDDDKVQQDNPEGCRTGMLFCGLKNQKYPDARPMGFPFDRIAGSNVELLNQFLLPNMKTTKLVIQFSNTVIPRQASLNAV